LPSAEEVVERWTDIQQKFFETVQGEYIPKFILERKFDIEEELEIEEIELLFMALDLGVKEAEEKLIKLGFWGDYENMKNQYLRKLTTYNKHKAEKTKININVAKNDYYVMLASVRKAGFNVQSDMLLVEWCGILNEIKESNVR